MQIGPPHGGCCYALVCELSCSCNLTTLISSLCPHLLSLRRTYSKLHMVLNLLCLAFSAAGLFAIFSNKNLLGKPHFTSYHSYAGLAAMASYLGAAAYVRDQLHCRSCCWVLLLGVGCCSVRLPCCLLSCHALCSCAPPPFFIYLISHCLVWCLCSYQGLYLACGRGSKVRWLWFNPLHKNGGALAFLLGAFAALLGMQSAWATRVLGDTLSIALSAAIAAIVALNYSSIIPSFSQST